MFSSSPLLTVLTIVISNQLCVYSDLEKPSALGHTRILSFTSCPREKRNALQGSLSGAEQHCIGCSLQHLQPEGGNKELHLLDFHYEVCLWFAENYRPSLFLSSLHWEASTFFVSSAKEVSREVPHNICKGFFATDVLVDMAHGKLRKHFSSSSWKGIFSFDPKGYHKIFQRRDKNLSQGNCVSCLTLTLFPREYCCHLQWQHFSSLQCLLPPLTCFRAICCLGVPTHLHLNPFSIRAFPLHEPSQPSLQFRSWQLFLWGSTLSSHTKNHTEASQSFCYRTDLPFSEEEAAILFFQNREHRKS